MKGRWRFALAGVVGAAALASCGEELASNHDDEAPRVDASTDGNAVVDVDNDAGCFIDWDASAVVFSDVPPDAAGTKEIVELGEDGILDSCGDAAFCPDQATQRRALVRWAVRAAYAPPRIAWSCEAIFKDIGPADPDYAYFHKAKQVGLISGCAVGKACPDLVVSRGQLAVLATALAAKTPSDASTSRFADVPAGNSLLGFIERAAELELISPCNTFSTPDAGDASSNFCPEGNATRRTVAIAIDRARALR